MAAMNGINAEKVPPFVLNYAPLVWLHSKEDYLPSDIGSQLMHTTPKYSHKHPTSPGATISGYPSPLTLDNLDALNKFDSPNEVDKIGDTGNDVYLSSNQDVTTDPAWIKGVQPDMKGKTQGATSCCIIVNDHGTGYVDAFYMYFYAYNQGQIIFQKELGDHLGDWEHNMIRFKHGVPVSMWFSQHASGEALAYMSAVQKLHNRPVSYSARGTHANYASAGTHSHVIPRFNLPLGLLEDVTDEGHLWDPTLSAYIYAYTPKFPGKDIREGMFKAYNGIDPTAWLQFKGHWGDDAFPMSDPRQHDKNIGEHLKFEGGPTGPLDKMLERKNVWTDGAWGEHIWKLLPWA